MSHANFAHRGEILAIANVDIQKTETTITYNFDLENINNKNLTGVKIEFLKNGESIDAFYYTYFSATPKFRKNGFSFPLKDIDTEQDEIQIEITQIFNKHFDWGGWDSPNILNKQTNTLASEFYVDAPWRMSKTDAQGNINSIPVHFFLHDADNFTGTLKIDYINIKLKDATSSTFGPVLTYNTLPSATFNAMFSSQSVDDASFGIQAFDVQSLTPTASKTFDFDIESDFIDDFVSTTRTYWYFTFNILASDLAGFGDVIDIEATISYANLAIPTDDVIRMRVFRSSEAIPTLPNFYRGDTHLHSMYTQSDAEIGLPMSATKEAGKMIGLDWITTTDHTSDFDNYGTQNIQTNWSLLQAETAQLNSDDPSMIYILGQEVAVNNSEGKLVHMLAYPNELAPYGLPFLGDGGGDLSSTSVSIDNVITQLQTVDGFAYCSHPFGTFDALPTVPVNGGIWNLGDNGFPVNGNNFPQTGGAIICNDLNRPSDIFVGSSTQLIKQGIKGSQIWNMRENVQADGSAGDDLDPWDVTNSGTPMTQVDTAAFDFHYKRFLQGQEVVNYVNQLGLTLKNSDNAFTNWKMYYSAGADAHGSFNSSNTENFATTGIINNNAVGKVNTVVYCPNGMGANGENVLNALSNGNSTISDGPLITIGISKDGDNTTSELLMGQDGLLDEVYVADTYINFDYMTTPEFGDITEFYFIVGTELGETKIPMTLSNTMGNIHESFLLTDLLESIFGVGNVPQYEYFYVRAEMTTFRDYSAQTNIYRTDFDYFHSLTNPIWIKYISSVGIDENNANDISIYPNPTKSEIRIELGENSNYTNIEIYNNLGQIVYVANIQNSMNAINVSTFESGIYNLVIYNSNGEPFRRKVVKL